MNKRIIWLLAATAVLVAGTGLAAAQMGGYGMGPGMMYGAAPATRAGPNTAGPGYYGMGPGAARGYGAGYGMGPGAMYGYGRYGMGPGMMGAYGGYGMGPGMMGGYGAGYGMGPGMMYGYGGYGTGLGLSAQQRDKVAGIWNETMRQSWPIMGQLHEQYFQLARLADSENPDRTTIDKVYGQISDLQRKLLDLRLQARRQMLEVLTPEQRKQMQAGSYYNW